MNYCLTIQSVLSCWTRDAVICPGLNPRVLLCIRPHFQRKSPVGATTYCSPLYFIPVDPDRYYNFLFGVSDTIMAEVLDSLTLIICPNYKVKGIRFVIQLKWADIDCTQEI